MAFPKEIVNNNFILDEYYEKGMQGWGKAHHLQIEEAMEATGPTKQQVVVSCINIKD